MIKDSLIYEIEKEEVEEAIRAVIKLRNFCATRPCRNCPFVMEGLCYFSLEDNSTPVTWNLKELSMD